MISCDFSLFLGFISAVATIVGLVYAIMRNFKIDVIARMDKMESRIDSLEERMFYMATGKTLSAAILEEKMKNQPKTNP